MQKSAYGICRRALLTSVGAALWLASGETLAAPVTTPRDRYRGGIEPAEESSAVYFWNAVALQLVALDHSVDAEDARAPGPCASARALALAHLVIADAYAALDQRAGPLLAPVSRTDIGDGYRAAFVGGAAAAILEHIYTTPAHAFYIDLSRSQFLRRFDERARSAWSSGVEFGRRTQYSALWNWVHIRDTLFRSPTAYVPEPFKHNVDPFNADQGFYGVGWGGYEPLLLARRDLVRLTIDDPPDLGSREYLENIREVLEIGSYGERGPTEDQLIGLFYAYDGARLIGTPPRLYNQILRRILLADGVSEGQAARVLALCNAAMADSGIACWAAKYKYAVWRPVYGIRNHRAYRNRDWRPLGSPRTNPAEFTLGQDGRTREFVQNRVGASSIRSMRDERTRDYKLAAFTPNFPSYPSGHSTFGGACFGMLNLLRAEYGVRDPNLLSEPVTFVSDELNGVSIDNFENKPRPHFPVRYRDIRHIVRDNDRSRILLGVHWRFDTDAGTKLGSQVAQAIYRSGTSRR